MFMYFQELFGEMGNIASFVTIAVTILGAASLMLANAARYFQAKKYGIPIKAVHQANIADSADLWVTFIVTIGLGFFIPAFLLNVNLPWPALVGLVSLCFFFALLSTKTFNTIISDDIKLDISIIYCAVVAVGAAFAYRQFHGIHYNLLISEIEIEISAGVFSISFAAFRIIVYISLLGLMLFVKVRDRLFGGRKNVTTIIGGQLYMAAMRHNQYQWILMPVEVDEGHRRMKRFPTVTVGFSYLKFTRGLFVVRDLSTLPGELTTMFGPRPIDKTVAKVERRIEKQPESEVKEEEPPSEANGQ